MLPRKRQFADVLPSLIRSKMLEDVVQVWKVLFDNLRSNVAFSGLSKVVAVCFLAANDRLCSLIAT